MTFPGNERRRAIKGFVNAVRAWFRDDERGVAFANLSPLAALAHVDARS